MYTAGRHVQPSHEFFDISYTYVQIHYWLQYDCSFDNTAYEPHDILSKTRWYDNNAFVKKKKNLNQGPMTSKKK